MHFLEGQLTISPMRWWLVPSWSDGPSTKFAMFNARIESVQTSRAYKGPLKYRRGIVPASAFMEWQTVAGKKQPYYFTGDPTPLALAAIWEEWGGEGGKCRVDGKWVTGSAALSLFVPRRSA